VLKRSTIISLTIAAWGIAVGVCAHYWVAAVAPEGEYEPRLNQLLALFAFFIDIFPYFLIGIVIIVIAELIFIPGPHGKPGQMV